MNKGKLVINTLVFLDELNSGVSQSKLLDKVSEMGIKSIEVRREFIKDFDTELVKIKDKSQRNDITLFYSVPECLFEDDKLRKIYIEKGRENLLPIMILGANCLRQLTLKKISSLISFPANGLPSSLQSLQIYNCENLEFLSHETSHKYTSLEDLYIWGSCHSLSFFPLDCFPALKDLDIRNCPSLEAITIQGGGDAPNLSHFFVSGCEKLSSLPEQITLHALEYFILIDVPQLVSFAARCLPSSLKTLRVDVGVLLCVSKDELGLLFQRLTSLSFLELHKGCGEEEDVVNTLLKKQLLPTSLTRLYLDDFTDIKLLEGKELLIYML